MRRIFERSRCRCPRCVAKRRIQFIAVFGACLAAAAGSYLLVHHSVPSVPRTLSPQEKLAEEPAPDLNVILERRAQSLSIAATQLRALWNEQDHKNAQESLVKEGSWANSPERSENLALPDIHRNLPENGSSNIAGGVPIPPTAERQPVQPSEAPKSPSKVDVQRLAQPDNEKAAAMTAQSSPEPANSYLPIRFSEGGGVNKNSAENVTVDPSNPYGLLSQRLTESRRTVQRKSEETSLDRSELLAQKQENATEHSVSETPAITTPPNTDSKSDASNSDKPPEDADRAPEVTQTEMPGKQPEPPSAEKSDVAPPNSAAYSIAGPCFSGPEVRTAVNVSPTPSSREVIAAKEADSATRPLPDEAPAGVNGSRAQAPEPPPGETSEVAPNAVARSIADPSFAGPAAPLTVNVSPTPSNGRVVATEAADAREKKSPEDVAMANTSGSDKPFAPQPQETGSAIQPIPGEALDSGNGPRVQAQQNKIKEPRPKPPATVLVASLGKNTSGEILPQEPRKPRGYITINSEPEAPQNQEAEDHPPKPRDHPSKAQNHPSNIADYPSKPVGHSEKPQDQPPSVRDYLSNTPERPSNPPDTSRDLRRFASSYLHADQTGNIAEQHRFFADSVHFYHEGDLSWAGVAAATRRYHQERQNKRYGVEGTATVKGPVNGGFYVVEQPVSWSRSDGSRVTRGRSVLRLRVVPTDRNGWKITSIEEIGQQ